MVLGGYDDGYDVDSIVFVGDADVARSLDLRNDGDFALVAPFYIEGQGKIRFDNYGVLEMISWGASEGSSSLSFNTTGGYIKNHEHGTVTITPAPFRTLYLTAVAEGEGAEGLISNNDSALFRIIGGDSGYALQYNALNSGTGVIENNDEGTFLIQGGSGVSGIVGNSAGTGSIGFIRNTGKGTLTIKGGEGHGATGLESNASYDGEGLIENSGSGNLIIVGGSSSYGVSYGMLSNADGSGSIGTISNSGTGTLTITGESHVGIGINADGSGSTGTISNTSSGTLTITGGSDSFAFGIDTNASDPGSLGTISNAGEGTLIITGGSGIEAGGFYYNANGGTGTITNIGSGNLTIKGGSGRDAYGIGTNADGSGSIGTISNIGSGTLTVLGGDAEGAFGISSNASAHASGNIFNEGKGTLIISGGTAEQTYGINANAWNYVVGEGGYAVGKIANTGSGTLVIQNNGLQYNTAGIGGEGIISNEGDGKLQIKGADAVPEDFPEGQEYTGYGIAGNAFSEGSVATISNSGKGILEISGGAVASGIYVNATRTGTGIIENNGEGTLKILGSSTGYGCGIDTGADGPESQSVIANRGSGELSIVGGGFEDTNGISALAANEMSSSLVTNEGSGHLIIRGGNALNAYGVGTGVYGTSTSTISNVAGGTLTIEAGSADHAGGIGVLATDGEGKIENSGSGILTIVGGAEAGSTYATGIETVATSGVASIVNSGNGTLTIRGNAGVEGYGIGIGATTGGKATVSNGVNGTLNLLKDHSEAIGALTGDEYGTFRLENAGEMNMNADAIKSFGAGDVLVTNASTGTVNAEAGAIFVKEGDETQTGQASIGFIQKSETDWNAGTTTVDGFELSENVQAWSLKDDWRLHSKWEDGGSLVITDVMEGSLAAQQIEAAFRETFGTGTSLTFKGENDEASEGLAPKFTTAVANALIAQGYSQSIVTNFNLDVTDASGNAQALVVGGSDEGAIADSIGFRQIQGASSVTVTGDKTLALIGNVEGQDLIEGGGAVALDNGGLLLGADAGHEATTGNLTTVSMNNESRVTAENGWFRMQNLAGDGTVTVRENGRLYAADMKVVGDVDNDGTVSADSLTISGGTFTTSNVLKSEGRISVTESGTLSADGILASDTLDVKGVLKRGQSVTVYTGQQALKLMRERHADVAAELDRLEGKAEVSTMSVLDRIVAQSMKKTENTETEQEGSEVSGSGTSSKTDGSTSSSTSSSSGTVVSPHRRAAPVLPQDAQAFAAFDAVNRVVSNIEEGANPDGHGLWVKLLTGESEFGVRTGTKFEVDSDGAVIGAEAKLDPSLKIGAALSYLDGEIDSGALKSDWKSYGLTAYAHYRAGDFGLKGTAGWLRGTTQAAEDYDADVWHAGIRSEYGFAAGPVTITPFLGVRLMSGSFDGTDSKTVFNAPVGLKLSGNLSTGGWTIAPALEAAYVRSMGDTDAEDVRFLPVNAFEGSLSVKAEKGAWTGELSYRGAVGSNDYEDRAFEVRIGMKF